ncbi:hypothetical protein GCM10023334_091750 [Nonomuraea thailandensis]
MGRLVAVRRRAGPRAMRRPAGAWLLRGMLRPVTLGGAVTLGRPVTLRRPVTVGGAVGRGRAVASLRRSRALPGTPRSRMVGLRLRRLRRVCHAPIVVQPLTFCPNYPTNRHTGRLAAPRSFGRAEPDQGRMPARARRP